MSFFDTLNQIGGAVGTAGSVIATYLAGKIREVKEAAKEAKKERQRAEEVRDSIEDVLNQVRSLAESARRGVRLELEDRLSQIQLHHRPTIPDGIMSAVQIEARLGEVHRRIDEERDARHRLQRELSDASKEEERQWNSLRDTLAQIQTEIAVIKERTRR